MILFYILNCYSSIILDYFFYNAMLNSYCVKKKKNISEIYEKNIPSWLEELCSQMRKSENFIEGTDRMYALCDRSREHISRSMKKYLGVTVTEFINNLRLNYIASMLKNSNHSIAEIVFESGFNNLSWANEQFKAKFSTTMSKYRKT